MLRLLCWLAFLAGWMIQDPDYDALIIRLRLSDPKDREQVAARLAGAGEKVLPLLEKEISKTKDREVLARLEQVKARIRLRLHTPALDEAFSASFRRAVPDLVKRLRNPTPEDLLEALEASTGYKVVLEPRQGRPVAVNGDKIPDATKADAILIFRITLSVLPPCEQLEAWKSVKVAMRPTAHLFKTSALLEASLIHLDDPDREFRGVIQEFSEYGQRRQLVPSYLRMLEGSPPDVQRHAAWKLRTLNPGEWAEDVAAWIGKTDGTVRAWLIESLARTGDSRWKDLLLKQAGNQNPTVQASAVSALALLDPASAIPQVLKMLDSSDSQVLQSGVRAGWGLADPRITQAMERIILKSSDVLAANQAVYMLALCPPENFPEILEKAMKHSSYLVRNAAAVNAHSTGGDGVVRALKALLEDPEPAVRQNARRTLGTLKVEGFENPKQPASLLTNLDDPACLPILLESLETENEQAAIDGFMRLRSPRIYSDTMDLEISWPKDRSPTVKEVLDAASSALKSKGVVLTVKLAPVDEKPRVRRNSNRMSVGLLYWQISVSLGHEYGWHLEEGSLSLIPIDEARRVWRDWAQKQILKK